MKKVQVMFVGGFLGAGKTTVLWQAAELLMKRGKRVGLITNDQAPDLVDTKWLVAGCKSTSGTCAACVPAGPSPPIVTKPSYASEESAVLSWLLNHVLFDPGAGRPDDEAAVPAAADNRAGPRTISGAVRCDGERHMASVNRRDTAGG